MTSCGTWSGFEQARPTTTRGHLRDRRASAAHLQRGDLSDGLVFDAVRVRLIEIGEAVKTLPEDLLTSEDQIPWSDIARLRDLLAHRYFDTSHSIRQATVDHDLPALNTAILRLLNASDEDGVQIHNS
jgi:uncharacterized protein with HEPN domain